MQLTVIIVNYNVRAFLEKCLTSVEQALKGISGEVIVVDNASVDDSVAVVKSRFPEVELIESAQNLGFARANNLAIRRARGKYILLLNPDTVVSEDTFSRCLDFMERHPDASAVGVKMVDGTGEWLPESKRGLPTPRAAFFKLTGINALFPRSNFFNGYYLGGLDRDETHAVDVLTGAFMFIRKKVLDEIGLLDEKYFMYGEDIDLSYRMIKAGYRNYYLPDTSIIHYKGESTKRSSFQYVRTFYRAMSIFVRKHYSGGKGAALSAFLQAGIIVRAVISGLRRIGQLMFLPLMDVFLTAASMYAVKEFWARWFFGNPDHFTGQFDTVNLPLYTAIWVSGLALFGAYDKGRSSKRLIGGIAFGTVAILVVYALLSEPFRSSRAVIFITAGVLCVVLSLWTALINMLKPRSRHRRIVVVANENESGRIMELLNRVDSRLTIVGFIPAHAQNTAGGMGRLGELPRIIRDYQVNEVIFSSHDLSFSEISKWMTELGSKVHFKIASARSDELVGSNSKKLMGDSYALDIEFAISDSLHRRNKRIFDVVVATAVLAFSPAGIFSRGYRRILTAALSVFKGKHTWVSYLPDDPLRSELPDLKPGILSVAEGRYVAGFKPDELHMINYLYAQEYRVWRDAEVTFKGFANLL